MEENVISIEMAKIFKNFGCKVESKYCYAIDENELPELILTKTANELNYDKVYPAYNILSEIMQTGYRAFFGFDNHSDSEVRTMRYRIVSDYLREGQKQEAEDYILDRGLFNPKTLEAEKETKSKY